ncbi:glyoxylase-like metal-dependent hydrolase (beta-lactamase superfamily II) [Rudaeicoccus suwonensis]|uniref:Glyoxylase-like metal-dependent hydrolase (Beta-lactamase superfamily II) n=1 Tax=Rudaeicoccus suwonensis TaxID=657409 RepID=A0A561EB85_9MICO|nr:glyoxylase-like metal-dependent hydrolase (beta-lactamase superfamily II) [Rudaeicoccus suwonensis]
MPGTLGGVLAVSFPAAAFGTNCYVMATGRGQECVVVDPGIGVEEQLREVLQEFGLKPAAVLLTHGHIDHVYSVTPVCGGQIGAYIHTDDRYRLRDPLTSVGPQIIGMFEQQFGSRATWTEPSDVVEVVGGQQLEIAGMRFGIRHAPGHTEGSVMFALDGIPDGVPAEAEVTTTMLTGDVLFAGSIGRTDLPGGDHAAMERSLREVVLPLTDDTLLLPGHGPGSTMARERATNPYLQNL